MPKVAPYFLYMQEFQRNEEQRTGQKLSMPEVSMLASESWSRMSDAEKNVYKARAKGTPVESSWSGASRGSSAVGAPSQKKTSQGMPMSWIQNQEIAKKNEIKRMHNRIDVMLERVPIMSEFHRYPIYFMSANYFYQNRKLEYSLAEIALVRFTFRNGIEKRYHQFLNPGDVELGYAYEAKRFSDQTHHLPPPPRALGDQDSFVKAYEQFKNALDSDASGAFDNDKPIVFTMCEDHTTDQIDMLKQFWSTFNAQRMPEVDVFPMKRLYFAMKNKLAAMGQAQELKTEGLVNILLGNDPYELKSKISCEFHEEDDSTTHCALGRATRWAYMMADHFCQSFGIEMIPGQHLPKDIELRATMPRSWSQSSLALTTSDSLTSLNSNTDSEPLRGGMPIGGWESVDNSDAGSEISVATVASNRSFRSSRSSLLDVIGRSRANH